MHIVICEDEPNIAEAVKERLIKKYGAVDIDIYTSGEDMISAFFKRAESGVEPFSASSRKNSDIIILDVMMPGMDGFEAARRLRAGGDKSIIIFLTGNEDQVFDAFKVEAFRYLVKPVDDEKLYEAVDAAAEKLKATTKKYIFIRHDGVASKINTEDIIFAETYGRKITLHTKNGVFDYYGKLGELSDELGSDFFISHRSYIVNLACVEGYDSKEIRLDGGLTAILSRNRYSEFVKVYSDFIRR